MIYQSLLAGFCLLMAGCDSTEEGVSIQWVEAPPETVARYEMFRTTFQIDGLTGNPFDPDEIDVSLKITTPSGRQLEHPAFFTRDHTILIDHGREMIRDSGFSHWEIRWTPTEIGTYEWELSVRFSDESAVAQGRLNCTEGTGQSFIRISDSDPNYFETSEGEFFYPLGHTTRSPFEKRWESLTFPFDSALPKKGDRAPDGSLKTAKYDSWFRKMRENGENFCAVWMAPWWLELEWSPTRPGYSGLGNYNQIHAAQLDKIFELAEKYEIYVMLFTMNHGRLSTVIDREWFDNPHYSGNEGGTVRTPVEFFKSPECRRSEEQRLRYILARWGYSPALFGICLCSEVDWVDPYHGKAAEEGSGIKEGIADPLYEIPKQQEMVELWFRDMSRYVHKMDLHDHLVSIQFARLENGHAAWRHPELEIVMNNIYRGYFNSDYIHRELDQHAEGIADVLLGWSRCFEQPGKPRLIAEWGGSHLSNFSSSLETELRTGIWALSMTDLSGVTGFWWHDAIDQYEMYPYFASLQRFWGDYDRRGKKLVARDADVCLKIDNSIAEKFATDVFQEHPARRAILLSNESEVFGYIYHHYGNTTHVPAGGASEMLYPGEEEAWLQLPSDFKEGDYQAEFWDPAAGRVIKQVTVKLDAEKDGTVHMKLPEFRVDLAVKLRVLPKP